MRYFFLKFNGLLLLMLAFFSCGRTPEAEVKKQNVNDIELAYYIRGQGDPLVMIMGFRGTMAMWDPKLLARLEKNYTLILFDNRGAGLSSDTEKNETTISQMAEDTADLLEALGYSQAHVLGWSMGSRIAMELALNFPDKVKSLILCSPNPGGKKQAKQHTAAYATLLETDLSTEEGLALIFPTSEEGKKAASAYVERLKKAIMDAKVPYDLRVMSRTVQRQKEALHLWDENEEVYKRLSSIHAPTLVAGGGEDRLDPLQNVALVASQIQFAWTAYYPKAGHNFLSQEASPFAELVDLFIRTNNYQSKE